MLKENREITGTLIWYYFICQREVWLMARHLTPDKDNTFIAIGRQISTNSYKDEKKKVKIGNLEIDVIKKEDGEVLVGEVKKSSRFLKAATMQLAFYLYRLKQMGIIAKGELLIPKEKKKILVELTEELENELLESQKNIFKIIDQEKPPEVKRIIYCSKCGYRELCWS